MWSANKMMTLFAGMLVFAILLIAYAAPKEAWNPVCYKGYRYTVDALGVMRPIQTKYGVQQCLTGEIDVSR